MFNPQKKVVEPQVDSPLNKEVGDYIQLQKEAKEDYTQTPKRRGWKHVPLHKRKGQKPCPQNWKLKAYSTSQKEGSTPCSIFQNEKSKACLTK